MRCATWVLLLLGAVPGTARAQAASAPASAAAPRADVAVSAGWFAADRGVPGDCCSWWSSSLFKGVSAGYYWTDHLKTAFEIAVPGPTEGYGAPSPRLSNGSIIYTSEEHAYRDTRFSIAQAYQFGRNAMFHPFVVAGVDVDRERDEVDRSVFSNGRLLQQSRSTQNSTRARPFAGVGFKAYFSERTFFAGEARMNVGNRLEQTVWKAGIGIDVPSTRRTTPGRSTMGASPARPRGGDPVELWRAYAAHLKVGSLIEVGAAGGEQLIGELVQVDESGILVQPHTRLPEPLRHVPFDQLERLALHTRSTGAARVGAAAAGTGVGAGVFMTLLIVMLSHFGG